MDDILLNEFVINSAKKRELTDILKALESLSRTEFAVELSHEKMLEDEDYFNVVVRELSALNNPDINALINEIRLLLGQGSAAKETPVTPNTSKSPITGYLLVSVILVGILAGLGYLLTSAKPSESEGAVNATSSPKVHMQTQAEAPTPTKIEQQVEVSLLPSDAPELLFSLHGPARLVHELTPQLVEGYVTSLGVDEMMWVSESKASRQLQFVSQGKVQAISLDTSALETSLNALVSGAADIAMSEQRIGLEPAARYSNQLGDLRANSNEHVVALDGIVVIANKNNPVRQLSIESLAGIYAGEITNWLSVGGPDLAISAIAPRAGTVAAALFEERILTAQGKRATGVVKKTDFAGVAQAVAASKGAIGFLPLSQQGDTKALALVEIPGTAAKQPNHMDLANEEYPLSNRIFYYLPQHHREQAKQFVSFVNSVAGQELAEKAGFVAQRIDIEKKPLSSELPQKYKRYIENAQRLSLSFRFDAGDKQLDSKGISDLERLTDYMLQHPQKSLVLVGFSDSVGISEKNQVLSLRRARHVGKALRERGISVTDIVGLGEDVPLTHGVSDSDRARNRRIEVWML